MYVFKRASWKLLLEADPSESTKSCKNEEYESEA
jgi:hypothetical protein